MRQARLYSLGTFVSTLDISDMAPALVRLEKTRGPGHYTIWSDPEDLLELVTETKPIPSM